MTLTDEEVRKLAQSLSERPEQMTANRILDLIETRGGKPLNTPEAKCQAFASMFRTLLSGSDIQKMLRLTRERSHFQTVLKVLQERVTTGSATYPGELTAAAGIIDRMTNADAEVDHDIQTLQSDALERKIWLLKRVVTVLTDLKCDEKFDVPSTRMRPIE